MIETACQGGIDVPIDAIQVTTGIREEEERLAMENKPGSFISFTIHYRPTDTAAGIDKVLEELARQNAEQRELRNNLSDGMKSLPASVLSLTVTVQVGATIATVNMKRR